MPSSQDRWSSLSSGPGSASVRDVKERLGEVEGGAEEEAEVKVEEEDAEEEEGAAAVADANIDATEGASASANAGAVVVVVSAELPWFAVFVLFKGGTVLGSAASRSARRSSRADVSDSAARIFVPSVVIRDMTK